MELKLTYYADSFIVQNVNTTFLLFMCYRFFDNSIDFYLLSFYAANLNPDVTSFCLTKVSMKIKSIASLVSLGFNILVKLVIYTG